MAEGDRAAAAPVYAARGQRGTVMRRRAMGLVLAMSVLGACHDKPKPPNSRPDWSRGSIDGIAPLMTPAAVAAALDRNHYRQIPWAPGQALLVDPLNRGTDAPCFSAPGRLMTISLYFFALREGRRLAVVNFYEPYRSAVPDAEREAHGRAFAATLRARLGEPAARSSGNGFQNLYWRRPGGGDELPDMITTSINRFDGANATLTSFWAHGQKLSDG